MITWPTLSRVNANFWFSGPRDCDRARKRLSLSYEDIRKLIDRIAREPRINIYDFLLPFALKKSSARADVGDDVASD